MSLHAARVSKLKCLHKKVFRYDKYNYWNLDDKNDKLNKYSKGKILKDTM